MADDSNLEAIQKQIQDALANVQAGLDAINKKARDVGGASSGLSMVDRTLTSMATKLVLPSVGLVAGLYGVAKAMEQVAVSSVQLQNFGRSAGFAVENVRLMQSTMRRMGASMQEANSTISNLGTKMQELAVFKQGSEFWQTMSRFPGGAEFANRLMAIADAGMKVGDQMAAVNEIVRTFNKQDERTKFALAQALHESVPTLENWSRKMERAAQLKLPPPMSPQERDDFLNSMADLELRFGRIWERVAGHGMETANDLEKSFGRVGVTSEGVISGINTFIDQGAEKVKATIREVQAIIDAYESASKKYTDIAHKVSEYWRPDLYRGARAGYSGGEMGPLVGKDYNVPPGMDPMGEDYTRPSRESTPNYNPRSGYPSSQRTEENKAAIRKFLDDASAASEAAGATVNKDDIEAAGKKAGSFWQWFKSQPGNPRTGSMQKRTSLEGTEQNALERGDYVMSSRRRTPADSFMLAAIPGSSIASTIKEDAKPGPDQHALRSILRKALGINDPGEPAPWDKGTSAATDFSSSRRTDELITVESDSSKTLIEIRDTLQRMETKEEGTGGGDGGGGGGGGGSGGGGGKRQGLARRLGIDASSGPVGGKAEGKTAERIAVAKAAAIDQLRKEGVPEANLEEAANLMVGQGLAESGLNPSATHDRGTGYGIYGARLERRTKMLNWLKENGYAPNDLAGQQKYMIHEAMTDPAYAKTKNVLMNANPENRAANTHAITGNFENPRIINNRTGQVGQAAGVRANAKALDNAAKGLAGSEKSDRVDTRGTGIRPELIKVYDRAANATGLYVGLTSGVRPGTSRHGEGYTGDFRLYSDKERKHVVMPDDPRAIEFARISGLGGAMSGGAGYMSTPDLIDIGIAKGRGGFTGAYSLNRSPGFKRGFEQGVRQRQEALARGENPTAQYDDVRATPSERGIAFNERYGAAARKSQEQTDVARARVDQVQSSSSAGAFGKINASVEFLNVPPGVKTSASADGNVFEDTKFQIHKTKQAGIYGQRLGYD